jgi:hypothetical protein
MTLILEMALLKALIALFYLIPLLIPVVKGLQSVPGVRCLALLGLLVSLLMIPAYGLHSATFSWQIYLPLPVCGLILNFYLFVTQRRIHSPVLHIVMLVLLVLAGLFSFGFFSS